MENYEFGKLVFWAMAWYCVLGYGILAWFYWLSTKDDNEKNLPNKK